MTTHNEVAGKSFKINRPDSALHHHVIEVEDYIGCMPGGESCLVTLSMSGNMAAMNALKYEKYSVDDAPFVYGKISGYGYIVSEKDLEEVL